jgi:hypothetical protein
VPADIALDIRARLAVIEFAARSLDKAPAFAFPLEMRVLFDRRGLIAGTESGQADREAITASALARFANFQAD